MAITGNGNASKEQVAAMLDSILKVKITKNYLDATDAIAAAVTLYNQAGKPEGVGRTSYSSWGSYIKDNPSKLKK